jgi:hypothetical protein
MLPACNFAERVQTEVHPLVVLRFCQACIAGENVMAISKQAPSPATTLKCFVPGSGFTSPRFAKHDNAFARGVASVLPKSLEMVIGEGGRSVGDLLNERFR